MQVAFQNENVLENNTSSAAKVAQNFGLGEAGVNFRNSQSNFKTHKVENETYGNRRIYSPYLSPSSGVVEVMADMRNNIDPIYMHNIARTKFFGISKPAKPADHLKINLLA
tara:strand:- start:186 stop:518 length:333 start_codon:yes stop_codon:yes gene_type:complete